MSIKDRDLKKSIILLRDISQKVNNLIEETDNNYLNFSLIKSNIEEVQKELGYVKEIFEIKSKNRKNSGNENAVQSTKFKEISDENYYNFGEKSNEEVDTDINIDFKIKRKIVIKSKNRKSKSFFRWLFNNLDV